MGDDHSQRAYRSSESIARTGQPRAAATTANDPLAELARLIGQNDPFAEGAQAAARLAESNGSPPAAQTPPQSFAPADFSMPPAQQHYAAESMGTAQYGVAAPSAYYASEQGVPAYLMARGNAEHAAYADDTAFAGDQDIYDDVAPPRRRIGLMVGLAAFVVAGSAAAFGYHAMFGPAGTQGPPPVIKADTTPSKIVPERPKDSAKLINERVGDGSEKIVAREERPVDIADKIGPAGFPPAAAVQPMPPQASAGSGVIATEPRKVHTIVIRPDGEEVPARRPAAPPAAAMPPAPAPQVTASAPPPARPAPPLAAAPAQTHEPAAHVTRVASSEPRSAAARNAPLSLSPDGPAPRAPTRIANAEPPALAAAPAATAPAVKKGGYAVQVSSQRSEKDAEAAYHALQNKFPKQLGGHSMFVHKVELGAKGTYYRALVGPFASQAEASALCSSLKSAGGSCLIQRN